jgi:hypothetical protein
MGKIKITVEREMSIEVPYDSTIDVLLDNWETMMRFLTYQNDTIKDAIVERAEDIRLMEEKDK